MTTTNETTTLPRRVTPDVADELARARARLADLEQNLAQAMLDDIAKRPGAGSKLAALERDTAAARQKVENLANALKLAEGQDARAEHDARVRMQASQFAAFKAHVKARYEAMVAICAAIETASREHQKFIEANRKLLAAVPIGTNMPAGSLSHHSTASLPGLGSGAELGDAHDMLAFEFYRHGTLVGDGNVCIALPGARPPNELLRRQPDKIRPAPEIIRETNNWIVGAVKEQIDAQTKVVA